MPAMPRAIRIAAAGDVHCDEDKREELEHAFAVVEDAVDLVLLAGDLTTYGELDQAEIVAALSGAGVHVLEGSWGIEDVDGTTVGIAGTKGFVGGFPDSALPDFGEPVLRQVYAETTAEAEALTAGLEAIADSDYRIVLLHYSPTMTTLEGEPRGIWPFLGTDRLAPPIVEYHPEVVLHGHTHAGSFEGFVGDVPVFNVALPVLGGRDFFVFELDGATVKAAA